MFTSLIAIRQKAFSQLGGLPKHHTVSLRKQLCYPLVAEGLPHVAGYEKHICGPIF